MNREKDDQLTKDATEIAAEIKMLVARCAAHRELAFGAYLLDLAIPEFEIAARRDMTPA
jgi:hypothetical protein